MRRRYPFELATGSPAQGTYRRPPSHRSGPSGKRSGLRRVVRFVQSMQPARPLP
jgi:hypothetical protein